MKKSLFGAKSGRNPAAQATIDYLVITGVIITIALVLVGISSSVATTPLKTTINTSGTIAAIAREVGLKEAIINNESQGILIIQNNQAEQITITSIKINQTTHPVTDGTIPPLSTKTITLQGLPSCNNANEITAELTINYLSASNLNKTANYNQTRFECNPNATINVANLNTICGNKICDTSLGENAANCPQDCTTLPTCGNLECNDGETITNCSKDCNLTNNLNQNVLCIYNSNLETSKQICDYYLEKRPGAQELDLNLTDDMFTNDDIINFAVPNGETGHVYERMVDINFYQNITVPILNYTKNHPEIIYIAAAKGIPINLQSFSPEGQLVTTMAANQYLLFDMNDFVSTYELSRKGIHNFANIDCLNNLIFDPSKCQRNSYGAKYRFMAAYLTGYTLNDTKMIIDKAQAPAPDLSKVKWLFDVPANAKPNSDYTAYSYGAVGYSMMTNESKIAKDYLIAQGVDENNIVISVTDDCPTPFTDEIVAFAGAGSHHQTVNCSYDKDWITKNPKISVPVSNRAIIDAYESYFACTTTEGLCPNSFQSEISDALQPNTFRGTNYSRSFSGGVGTVNEPGGGGIIPISLFFSYYSSGNTFARSFVNSSRNAIQGMAIGDPIMIISEISQYRNSISLRANSLQCDFNSDCQSNLCAPDINGTKKCSAPGRCSDLSNSYLTGKSLCYIKNNQLYIASCNNSTWNFNLCAGACGVNNEDNAYCGLKDGDICTTADQCANDACLLDANGVKRCTTDNAQAAGECIFDKYSTTILNNKYICKDANTRIQCMNNTWTNEETCPISCQFGNCVDLNSNATFSINKGESKSFTLPTNPPDKKIIDLFPNWPKGFSVIVWKGEGYDYVEYDSDTNEWSDKNATLEIGQGAIINSSTESYSVTIPGELLDKSNIQPINIKGAISLIGIPFCNTYTATTLLAEIEQNQPSCNALQNSPTAPQYWWSNISLTDQQKQQRGLRDEYKHDFPIDPKGAYFILCDNSVDFNWTPSCG